MNSTTHDYRWRFCITTLEYLFTLTGVQAAKCAILTKRSSSENDDDKHYRMRESSLNSWGGVWSFKYWNKGNVIEKIIDDVFNHSRP